ncbi:hypothetical protein FHG87_011269 [Trinorchestia longiramus]|nr:hypothetical protein FHG87_011269 [Trinorchestia longiramus]
MNFNGSYPDLFDQYWAASNRQQLNGDVIRLLQNPDNRHIAEHLDSVNYQITYPEQLQRSGKSQGISTRDANKITVSKRIVFQLYKE